MKRQTVKRLMVKGIMTYIAVFSLVLMVAMPALALMANSIGTKEIRDHSIRSADIRNKAVTTDRIAPRAVKRGKIGKRAIRTEHVQSINGSKIKYSTKRRVLTIPAAAFAPIAGGNESKDSYMRFNSTGGVAPVQLPNGARVTKVEVLGRPEVSGSSKFRASLLSATDVQSQSGAFTQMATKLAPDNSSTWRNLATTTITNPLINNATKQYFVKGLLEPTSPALINIARARITYTIAAP